MKLSVVLKKLLAKEDITVAKLSRSTGVSDKMLYSWLNKQNPKDLNSVKKVADYFKVSLDYLLFDESRFEKKTSIADFKEEINLGQLEIILRAPKK